MKSSDIYIKKFMEEYYRLLAKISHYPVSTAEMDQLMTLPHPSTVTELIDDDE